ncbi:MAG: NAD-dependent epimerase/dehydratase family protein [Actinomycetota bacterium]
MRVVVTGGAGFIGANLSAALVAAGVDEVVALDDLSTGRPDNLAGCRAKLIEGSILDEGLLDEVITGSDAVVHLAARPSVPRSIEDPMASHTANATGTLMVLEAARRAGGPQVIVASSSSVYGANPTLPKSVDLRPQPLSPYAVSKLATETYALSHAHCYGLPVLAFRFFNVFGPLQPAGHAYAAVIPAFVEAAMAGRPIPIHGDGGQTRDFTYVGSLCSVICDAVLRRVTSAEPVNLAFGSRLSLLDVVTMIEESMGRSLEREHGASRAGDVRHSQADQGPLRALFPEVEPTPFRDGLEATIDWFRSLP